MTTKQTKPMCCVSIDYRSYLMPADVGMKLVALLNHAVECDRNYTGAGHRFHVKESASIYYYDDGVQHIARGCRGSVEFKMGVGERPLMSYKFTGVDYGASAVSNPALTLTAWKAPLVITDPNAGDIMLGAVTWATAALSGGTTFPSKGLSLNLGNTVSHIPLLGGESVDITNREVTGSVMLDLDAAGEVAAMTEVNANTLTALGFQFGTTTGYKIQIYGPKVQRINPKQEDQDGRRLIGFDLRFTPNTGNDELRIVTL